MDWLGGRSCRVLVVSLLSISAFTAEKGLDLELPPPEYQAGDIVIKAPDTEGADIVVDAPWRVTRREGESAEIPVLIYVPDTGLKESRFFGLVTQEPLGLEIKNLLIHHGERLLYWDSSEMSYPAFGASYEVVDEFGRRVDPKLASGLSACGRTGKRCDIPHPGGWHRIIRVPVSDLGNRSPVYLKVELLLSPVFDDETNREDITFSRTLRVQITRRELPSFGPDWHYFDAHMHTIAEWSLEEGLLAPKKAYGGPIQMIRESAHAIGLINSLSDAAFQGGVIVTDHNAFFSDAHVVSVGPSAETEVPCPDTDPSQLAKCRERATALKACRELDEERDACLGAAEFSRMRSEFGESFGEEVTLKTDTVRDSVSFGSHLLLHRSDHIPGPWHGGLLRWRLPGTDIRFGGGEDNHNQLSRVLSKASEAGYSDAPFAFAAHPFSWGNHWNLRAKAKNSLDRLQCRSDEFVNRRGKFVFKGAQYWNGKAARVLPSDRFLDFDDLHPFKAAPSTKQTIAAIPWKARSQYLDLVLPKKSWDTQLKRGLQDYHARVSCLLEFSFCPATKVSDRDRKRGEVELCHCPEEDPAEPQEVFPRKIYMTAGTDAHGDFNYETSLLATMLDHKLVQETGASKRMITTNAFGLVRTYVDGSEKPGELASSRFLEALGDGNSVLTDGPILRFSVDADLAFDSTNNRWIGIGASSPAPAFDEDGRIGGNGSLDGGFTALVARGQGRAAIGYEWRSNSDFGSTLFKGRPRRLELFIDRPEGSRSDGLSCALAHDEERRKLLPEVVWDEEHQAVGSAGRRNLVSFSDAWIDPDRPVALSMAAFADRARSEEEFRAYTNPIWIVPVDIEVRFGSRRTALAPGELQISARFGMSMLDALPPTWLQRFSAGGAPAGEPVPLVATGWETRDTDHGLRITRGALTIENSARISIGANERFGIVIESPRDLHGNRLNSVSAVLTRPAS